MSTKEKVTTVHNELVQNYKNKIGSLLSLCESPIEELFLVNFLGFCESKTGLECYTIFLYDYPETHGDTFTYKNTIKPFISYRTNNPVPWIPQGIKHISGYELTVSPQVEIETKYAKYRVDFLLEFLLPDSVVTKFVVECDGHEFHQKTKAQVMKDHERDRSLIESGFHVLRYSGSEIYSKSDFVQFAPLIDQIEKIVRLRFQNIDY